jgi:hypothetical protein
MLNGFPKITLAARPAPLTVDSDTKAISLEDPERVVVTYAALLRLGKLAKSATARKAVYGEVAGFQIGTVVEVTNVFPGRLHQEPIPQFESEAESRQREEQQAEADKRAKKRMNELCSDENLDTYVVGQFIVTSAMNRQNNLRTYDEMFQRGEGLNPSILLVLDHFCTGELGKLHVTAYTLTPNYMALLRAKSGKKSEVDERTALVEHGVLSSGLVKEIPVEIRLSALDKMMIHLTDYKRPQESTEVSVSASVESQIEELLEATANNCSNLTAKCKSDYPNALQQMVLLDQLRRQTQLLESLCDGTLLSCTLMESVE